MIVAIDTRWIFKELSGIGLYTKEIIRNIIYLDKENSYIILFNKPNVQVKIKEELVKLYQESVALLHPSLYEGFGLQIVEAMQSGTPVISSDGASLKEICADAAIVLPSKSPELFAENIERLIKSEDLQKELIAKGLKRAKDIISIYVKD